METQCKISTIPPISLSTASPERVNIQRIPKICNEAADSTTNKHHSERSVQDKVKAFDNIALQACRFSGGKISEAAYNRVILGREEAECEMRRYRDETRALRRAVEEGKRREMIVGERLDTLMESYGQSKETFEHTKLAWEKEIRRARKENFKTQSAFLKLQEELKSSRMAIRAAKSDLDAEKVRSNLREQEASQTRHELFQAQEEIAKLLERLKVAEQERDALRKIAEKEDIARIAAEGFLPLPISTLDDEFSSPKKFSSNFSPASVVYSAASEMELEDLRMQLSWEKQLASRAHDLIEFIETERRLNCNVFQTKVEAIFTKETSGVSQYSPPDMKPKIVESSRELLADDKHSLDRPIQTPSDKLSTGSLICDLPESSQHLHKNASPLVYSDIKKEVELTLSSAQIVPTRTDQEKSQIISNGTDEPPLKVRSEDMKSLDTNTLKPAKDTYLKFGPTLSRDAALAQIQERRGRARSLALGNSGRENQLMRNLGTRRNISAPAICSMGT
ncbi:putative pap2 superfamily protein [Golovinomyces cichoracearum]|uniref:Putative pap2 superfamily protein n=1 Tax=Golovinomyces cichoracearum TaxID=62708 RepID=A0A420IJA8_9PEZI|nr:putative pap2 superfamily protein [Golovinomyces cichoracearum]